MCHRYIFRAFIALFAFTVGLAVVKIAALTSHQFVEPANSVAKDFSFEALCRNADGIGVEWAGPRIPLFKVSNVGTESIYYFLDQNNLLIDVSIDPGETPLRFASDYQNVAIREFELAPSGSDWLVLHKARGSGPFKVFVRYSRGPSKETAQLEAIFDGNDRLPVFCR